MNDQGQHSSKQARRFKCDTCQHTFTRIDHLKRHQLRHSGVKPYACVFCQDTFARCDSLRHHYSECAARGEQPIPETDQKGRRRHSCLSCMNMKLKCSGITNGPCSSCLKRKVLCIRPDDAPTVRATSSPDAENVPADQRLANAPLADLGSIRPYLSGGQEGFLEDLSFPGQLVRSSQYPVTTLAPNSMDMSVLSQYRNAVNSFYEGPFDAYHLQWQESISGMRNTDTVWMVTQSMPPVPCDYPIYTEQQDPALADLTNALLITLSSLGLDARRRQELQADIYFLLIPKRCRHFHAMYVRMWHPNGPILHDIAAFAFDTVPPQLLAAVLFMGAMYTFDSRELAAAKHILDVIETYIFSSELFEPAAEIRRELSGVEDENSEAADWVSFQILQAAFLNIVVQHWAGNRLARERSMEVRFSQLTRVARNTGLLCVRHEDAESSNQSLWIERECRIRTINLMVCLDHAFVFFHNYPARFTLADLDRDLPCDEPLFQDPQPFSDPDFQLRRDLTVRKAYEMLFEDVKDEDEALVNSLTVLDMFILVHILYSTISDRLQQRVPFNTAVAPSQTAPTEPQSDTLMASSLVALARWRLLWDQVCVKTSPESWARAGFFRDSLRYWLVAKLVAERHGRVSGSWLLEPRCRDKLGRLHALAGEA